MVVEVKEVSTPEELAACRELRRRVFIVEQCVSEADEWDGLDGECRHFLCLADDEPVGTARLRLMPDGTAKAQRVAVLRARRGRGVGRAVMAALEAAAREAGCREVHLGAQLGALPFYQRLGYHAHGPVFDDAGIPHRHMSRELE
ncbi:MAG: GNAT family N-acetyltransferase [Armatimonadetes bacterium]|nr:GNAT family N-acetyltransferase [Armatimonadota bacterium]